MRRVATTQGLRLVAVLLVCAGQPATAHVTGGKVYSIPELTDADLEALDLSDGVVEDWRAVLGPPLLCAQDFVIMPPRTTSTDYNSHYDAADLDYEIWLGWHGGTHRIYVAVERTDDVYHAYTGPSEVEGPDSVRVWRYDTVTFAIDGDHSGGRYDAGSNPNCFGPCDERLESNRSAQWYVVSAQVPQQRHLWYAGYGNSWVTTPPKGDCDGGIGAEDRTVVECYVTAFDDLLYDDRPASQVSTLSSGKVIGFHISMPDFDLAPGNYRSLHTLSGADGTFFNASQFVDGLLVGADDPPTLVGDHAWARIKATFRERQAYRRRP